MAGMIADTLFEMQVRQKKDELLNQQSDDGKKKPENGELLSY